MNNKEFFDWVNRDINNSKSKEALVVLEKRLKKFLHTTLNSPYDIKIKKKAKKLYSKSMRLIKRKLKKVK